MFQECNHLASSQLVSFLKSTHVSEEFTSVLLQFGFLHAAVWNRKHFVLHVHNRKVSHLFFFSKNWLSPVSDFLLVVWYIPEHFPPFLCLLQVKYFCRTCETVICTLCIINQHEGHNVMEIQNMFRRHQEDITNLQKTIEAKLKALRDKGLELERLRSLNLKSSMQAEAKIKVKRHFFQNKKKISLAFNVRRETLWIAKISRQLLENFLESCWLNQIFAVNSLIWVRLCPCWSALVKNSVIWRMLDKSHTPGQQVPISVTVGNRRKISRGTMLDWNLWDPERCCALRMELEVSRESGSERA